MARARRDRVMTLAELRVRLDEEAPWPPASAYIGDGGAEDYEHVFSPVSKRRQAIGVALGFDRLETLLASHGFIEEEEDA